MINRLIDEINTALNSGLYLTALISALTLPDVCGKAESPTKGRKENAMRYKDWYRSYVKDGNLSADDVYALRCGLVHEGNIEPKRTNNVKFVLMSNEYTQPLGIDFCFDSMVTHADGSSERKITVYVGFLCTAICKAAQTYYQANKEKFSFLNYEIRDLSSVFKQKR